MYHYSCDHRIHNLGTQCFVGKTKISIFKKLRKQIFAGISFDVCLKQFFLWNFI